MALTLSRQYDRLVAVELTINQPNFCASASGINRWECARDLRMIRLGRWQAIVDVLPDVVIKHRLADLCREILRAGVRQVPVGQNDVACLASKEER